MIKRCWKVAIFLLVILALVAGFVWSIYIPLRLGNAIVDGLSSKSSAERDVAMTKLEGSRRLGFSKNKVEAQLRKMLVDTQGADLRPLIITVAGCSELGAGVNLADNLSDQKLVLDAFERFNKYALAKGHSTLHVSIQDNKFYVSPGAMVQHPDANGR